MDGTVRHKEGCSKLNWDSLPVFFLKKNLLGNYQIIVFLSALYEQVFFIQQVGGGNFLVKCSQFFFVQRNAAALNQLTHLTFDGKIAAFSVNKSTALMPASISDLATSNWERLRIQKRGIFIQFLQCFRSSVSKQDARSFYSSVVVSFRVNHDSYFLSQTFLEYTQVRSLFVFCNQAFYFFFAQWSEYLDITLSVFVAYIQPELIELVRRGISCVQPDISWFCLTKFTTVGFVISGQVRANTSPPLVRRINSAPVVMFPTGQNHPAEAYSFGFIQMQEIVSL